jgi:hypothetical protein
MISGSFQGQDNSDRMAVISLDTSVSVLKTCGERRMPLSHTRGTSFT